MYSDRFCLTIDDIEVKSFKIDARGYRPSEVDRYLDMVMKDYETYEKIISSLERNIKDLNDDNTKLKREIRRLQNELETASNSTASHSSNNVDILKRISNLEKVVYGNNE